jgi:hypothetical protein
MVRLISVYLRGSRKVSSSATGASRNKIQGPARAKPPVVLAPRCFIIGKATKNALMSVRNKSYPNKEQPKLNGLATFVTGVEGLKQNLVRAEMVEIPDLPQSKPRDKRSSNNARAKLPARTYNPAPHSPAAQPTTQSTFHRTRHGYQDVCTGGIGLPDERFYRLLSLQSAY